MKMKVDCKDLSLIYSKRVEIGWMYDQILRIQGFQVSSSKSAVCCTYMHGSDKGKIHYTISKLALSQCLLNELITYYHDVL